MNRRNISVLVLFLLANIIALSEPKPQPQYDGSDESNEIEEEDEEYILDIPDFVSKSDTVLVRRGDLLRLYCQLNGEITVPLMWVKKEDGKDRLLALGPKKLAKNKRLNVRTMDKNEGMILTMSSFDPDKDSGIYECQIMSENPKSIEFNVMEDIVEPDEPEDDDIEQGEDQENEDLAASEVSDDDKKGSATQTTVSHLMVIFCAVAFTLVFM